ncbi:MAG: hypothetical protein DRQ10_00540 [Candidatus Hydrothermota bacterium]|nr:MAG: hypothetical protein DRQ10_00540 [Candidatus Hydrothermae bacterium]
MNLKLKVLKALYKVWVSTLSFRATGQWPEFKGPAVLVLWHSKLMPFIYYLRQTPIVGLASQHPDADPIAVVMNHYGLEVVRGSSTRGSVKGTIGLLKALHAGKIVALTPDGPKGPARRFKEGALWLAQKLNIPMMFLGVGMAHAIRLPSWDRLELPVPFSRCVMKMKVVYPPPRKAADAERILNAVTSSAEREAKMAHIGWLPIWRCPSIRRINQTSPKTGK